MKVIMYHYIRPNSSQYPFFNNLTIEQFKSQLDYFEKNYNFISKQDFIEIINNKKKINKSIVLTFDDGLKDHIKYVLPELNKRNLWGIFYIPTKIFFYKKLLNVHRIHFLKGKYGSELILKKTLSIINKDMLDKVFFKKFNNKIYTSKKYNDSEKKLRQLFNYQLSYNHVDNILDSLCNDLIDEKKLHKNTYLNLNDLKKIHKSRSIIGVHTHAHRVLSRLNYNEQNKEINFSLDFLKKKIKIKKPYFFAYPYGYNASFDKNTIKSLKKNKFHNAVKFDNRDQYTVKNKYQISRLDCNKFIF
ncbi:polysaccharide deacetylase family protein [Pelagibacteraceae bacterium]|nr:polysaccharide deacetylase family protein [Pelagibacteraceae bacterium]